jgi:hypothetical protein
MRINQFVIYDLKMGPLLRGQRSNFPWMTLRVNFGTRSLNCVERLPDPSLTISLTSTKWLDISRKSDIVDFALGTGAKVNHFARLRKMVLRVIS